MRDRETLKSVFLNYAERYDTKNVMIHGTMGRFCRPIIRTINRGLSGGNMVGLRDKRTVQDH